ncbi:F-box/kelch-repeat protein At3g23880-like [Humulus lupulus]|uniref:F-box/kelch-repeat protein At3g23880-like n=1 Tax=Humulus lupulus TaxID=3486 RepID=UPI002B40D5DB|nr:F-box/kelch-repeat protein At3g23880-like [Humulus lupulus]
MQTFCENFPDELLEEIMSWLPPDSLRRFKFVCKSWRVLITSFIKNPAFVDKHLANMKNNKLRSPFIQFRNVLTTRNPESQKGNHFLTLFSDDYDDLDDTSYIPENLKFLTCYSSLKLVGHCNGIICLSSYHMNGVFVLLNPTLRELKVVSNAYPGDDSSSVGVAFNYDSRANEYKVVTIKSINKYGYGDGPYKAEVFTLSTNSWKEIELGMEILYFPSFDYQVVYCDGVCYWYFWYRTCTILSFDVSDEVFKIIPFNVPFIEREWVTLSKWTKLVVWNDRLVLFFYPELDPIVIDMWVMDASSDGVRGDYSWSKHLTIGPLENIKYPLEFWDADMLFMETKDGEFVFYNIHSKELDDHIVSLGPCHGNFGALSYAKSLVSILKREDN